MVAQALIRFVQNASTAGDGIAMLGTTGLVTTVENVDNTGIQSWQIDLLYSDPSSGVTPSTPFAFSDSGNTPTVSFTPDVSGSYRWQLKVWSVPNRVGTPDDKDIRVFSVLATNSLLIPPSQVWPSPLPDPRSGSPGNKPNEMNFGGQPDGWAGTGTNDGLLNDTLSKLLSTNPRIRYVDKGTSVPFVKQNGSRDLPYQTIQQALDDIGGAGSGWAIYIAPGSYNEALSVPSQNNIALIGSDYRVTQINISSLNDITWHIDGASYLALKNIQAYSLQAVDSGSTPPDVGTLYLENASLVSQTAGAYPIDIVAIGPNTFLESVQTSGHLAVDGVDHIFSVSCGSLAAYDTLLTGGTISINTGDAILTSCQMDFGTALVFSGYTQKLSVDGMSNYWLTASIVSILGSPTLTLMDNSMFGPGTAVTDNNLIVWDGVGGNKAKDSGVAVDAIATAQTTADSALARDMFALTGAANDIDGTHVGKVGTVSHTATTTYTVRLNANVAIAAKSEITLIAIGVGQLVIAAEGGGVVIRTAETLKARKQYSWVTLKKDATTQDLWYLTGDLELA